MFKGHGKSHGSRPKKEANTKKHHIRNWMHSRKKKKHEANLFAVMMSSGDTSVPAQQASISSTGSDMVDDARLGNKDLEKIGIIPLSSMKQTKSAEVAATDPEAIEEAVPIVRETQLMHAETKPKIQNGIDIDKKPYEEKVEDECLINCIYYTQECCSCTIV